MASIKQDLLQHHRELKPLILIYEKLAYSQSYYRVFEDFVDYCISEYSIQKDYQLPDYIKQPDTEPHDFKKMLDIIIGTCRKKCNAWSGGKPVGNGWYDAFGHFFETVASEFGKSYRGQFFTPENICTMMAQMTIQGPTEKVQTVCDSACGSGRLLLAAHAVNPNTCCYGNDIDYLCAKMCAVNFCLNGVVGEITCNDGLWPTDSNFRFGFKCVPLFMTTIAQNPYYQMMHFMSAEIRNQFVLLPLTFEESRYSIHPEKFQPLIQQETERRKAAAPDGLQGILFETEQADKAQNVKPSQRIKPTKPIDSPLTLF